MEQTALEDNEAVILYDNWYRMNLLKHYKVIAISGI